MLLILITLLFFNIPSVFADTAEQYLSAGNDDVEQGNLDQAIIDYTKAIDIDPNLSKAYDNRGVAYAKEGSLPRAIADFTMAIANNLKDAEAYNNRGHAYAQQGNLTQAVFDYSKAIELNAFYVKAYNNRERAYFELKEYDKVWSDIFAEELIGGKVDPEFFNDLKKVSGRNH